MKKILVGCLMVIANQASAQEGPMCAPTEKVLEGLQKVAKESIAFMGFDAKNRDVLITLWINKETGSSTIIKSSLVKDISCLVGSMEDSRIVDYVDKTKAEKHVNSFHSHTDSF